ncbi:hypothetical protein [Mucilaginibacter aquatilis]|uniref:Uncharacterized protein n=1 Tax=Mucilaginibacter aquatilis TaxID=1517760 RepID=A0A6I4I950_9SPHI|nr:hypothetical protein [Mucilaginibacter aquatilis]MVN90498.1 hypothetical protein [Mucilaginibacter aquatilis]
MTDIAQKYTISDVGFRKLCIRLNIPFPKSGDWTKIRSGHLVERPVLPVKHKGKGYAELEERPAEKSVKQVSELDLLIKQISREKLPFKVPDRLTRPDPLIVAAKESLAKLTDINHPGMAVTGKGQLDIRVTTANVGRALRFMDTLIKCVRARGHIFKAESDGNYVVIHKLRLRVNFRERTTRVRVLDKPYQDYEWQPNGKLVFRLDSRLKAEWQDLKTQLLEDQLPKVLAKLELAAKQEEAYLTNAQVWQQNWERQRKAQAEWDAEQRKELGDFKELVSRAKQWKLAQLLREYIATVREPDNDWLAWAKQKANWLDPIIMAEDEWMKSVNRNDFL